MDHNAKNMLIEILEALGMRFIAHDVRFQNDGNILDRYIKLVEKRALKTKATDILDRLYFSGLIY